MIMKGSSRLDELLTPSPSRARAWALPKKSSLEPTKKPEPRAELRFGPITIKKLLIRTFTLKGKGFHVP